MLFMSETDVAAMLAVAMTRDMAEVGWEEVEGEGWRGREGVAGRKREPKKVGGDCG
jgi:hypothetical protein